MTRAAAAKSRERGRPAQAGRGARPAGARPGAPLPEWLGLALVLAAAAAMQWAALRAPFYGDDFVLLDLVRSRSLLAALAASDPLRNFLRPVGGPLHFWVFSRLGAESPVVFHAVNLALFLGCLALLFLVARRLAGSRAALIATAFLAIHYAADVPVLWAAGSQDLWALFGGLAALALHLAGRRLWAALALLVGLFAKEAIALTPLIAAIADRREGEPWPRAARRAWPLGAALLLWAISWILNAQKRTIAAGTLSLDPAGLPAAFAHLLQVILGVEWSATWSLQGFPVVSLLLPVVLVGLALAAASGERGVRSSAADPKTAAGSSAAAGSSVASGNAPVVAGIAWALLGALPIFPVAAIWSAYYYLFALGGVGLALGAFLARRSRLIAFAALAILALGSQSARQIQEFNTGRGAWSTQSHVNRFYLERAMTRISQYFEGLRAARPSLPPNSTVFFSGIPSFVGFHIGDGPEVRWAYRDTSLRAYFLAGFSLDKLQRGPAYYFLVKDGRMLENTRPQVLRDLGYAMLLNDRPRLALDALTLHAQRHPDDAVGAYWLALVQWDLGDFAAGAESMRRARFGTDSTPAPEFPQAQKLASAGDTSAALQLLLRAMPRHSLNPELHGLVANLTLFEQNARIFGIIEAYAARVMRPRDFRAWRLWGTAQVLENRPDEALASFQRYLDLSGPDGAQDQQVARIMGVLRRTRPGGDLAQRGLREPISADR